MTITALWLFATPAAFGQGQTQSREPGPIIPVARGTTWASASALNALFRDKKDVKRFLNEFANEGVTSGPEFVGDIFVDVYEYRFIDLNGDGWLELVALVGGDWPSTGLEVVFQTPGGVPPADRLATTYEGFAIRELSGRNVPDLNELLRDLDGDGTCEIVMPQAVGEIVGAAFPQAEIPDVFAWKDGDFVNISARHPEFYRDEVVPRLERELRRLEALPAPEDSSEATDRRADRERVVREIAEARKGARQR